ncbi:MAG: translation elongation factor Ts [Eubacteriales bacterium]|nr:translation elongation factor Ts [Eubacteriales bacterium]
MAITATQVKELREQTGAGMLDSKKALEASNGNIEEAIEYLRKKGLAGAEKKAKRIAAEGICMVMLSDDNKEGAIVEVNSETDFVAKNEKFRTYVSNVCTQVLKSISKNVEEFLEEKWDLDKAKTVKEELASQIAVIGENLKIRRKELLKQTDGFISAYTHANGKIAVLLKVKTDKINDEIKEMAKNVCMQIAALNPKAIDESGISEETKKHEKEILLEAAKNEKPDANEKVLEGMVAGRLNKQLKEICLLNQVYVRSEDGKQTVDQYIKNISSKNGATLHVESFVRYETGEGLEKKHDDFAAEVAAQAK